MMKKWLILSLTLFGQQFVDAKDLVPDPLNLSNKNAKIKTEDAKDRQYFRNLADNRVNLEGGKLGSASCAFRVYKTSDKGVVFELLKDNKPIVELKTSDIHADKLKAEKKKSDSDKIVHSLQQNVHMSLLETRVVTPGRDKITMTITADSDDVIETVEFEETFNFKSLTSNPVAPKKYLCAFTDDFTEPDKEPNRPALILRDKVIRAK